MADKGELWIKRLNLKPHPEGGYYRETYRAAESIPASALPSRFGGPRTFSTSIYFLLRSPQVSVFHRLAADEVWHFYDGTPLSLYLLCSTFGLRKITLGSEPGPQHELEAVVPAGTWFAAEPAQGGWSLVGCTVAPGFEFSDLQLAEESDLVDLAPDEGALVSRLCRR